MQGGHRRRAPRRRRRPTCGWRCRAASRPPRSCAPWCRGDRGASRTSVADLGGRGRGRGSRRGARARSRSSWPRARAELDRAPPSSQTSASPAKAPAGDGRGRAGQGGALRRRGATSWRRGCGSSRCDAAEPTSTRSSSSACASASSACTACSTALGQPRARDSTPSTWSGRTARARLTLYAEALLLAEGIATGAYLSPHLTSFRERIRIGGAEIDPAGLRGGGAARARGGRSRRDPVRGAHGRCVSWRSPPPASRWAVVEAGLGGRLDATNVLARSRVQVLTNVSLEHTELLGETREAIAAEKAAVVPAGGVVVVGEPGWEGFVPQARTVKQVTVAGTYQDQNRAVAHGGDRARPRPRVDPAPMLAVRIPGRHGGARHRAARDLGRRPQPGGHAPAGVRAAGPRRGSPLRGGVLDARREGRRGDGRAPAPGLPDDRRYTIDQLHARLQRIH